MLNWIAVLLVALAGAVGAQGTPDRAELEQRFVELLTGARLVGHYTDNNAPLEALPEAESYAIQGIERTDEGRWRVTALIEFGRGRFPVDIEVDVDFAGDTPMILVTDKSIPLVGTYSSRVLFDGERYAGTWYGGGHGGHLFGRIERDTARAFADVAPEDVQWPSFRGPQASGHARGAASGAELAIDWDIESGRNVLWRTPVPGLAHSSPVVAGDRVFVTTAVSTAASAEDAELVVGLYGSIGSVEDEGEHEFRLLCLDRRTGDLVWQRTAHKGTPRYKRHPKGSHAASSPATDGRYVVAFFGAEGLHVYDVNGTHVWSKGLGALDSGFFMVKSAQWGFASSPVIAGERLVVQCDVQENSFLAAFDLASGEELWRTPREDVPTWSSPTIDTANGRVLVNGYKHKGAYDLETGAELWRMEGGGDIPVPTPILAHDLAFFTSAHGRMAPITAVSTTAVGELTLDAAESEHVAWSQDRRGNYMQTPIVADDLLYTCSDNGIVRCYDARTGESVFQGERMAGGTTGFTSSPVYGGGNLYYASEEGDVHVVRVGREFEEIAVNGLGETCMASPAIADGVLFYRTRGHVVALGESR